MLTQRNTGGFTLIELLVTIAIVAVLATIAAPSFSVVIANTKIRASSQAINDGLQLARAEAIRLNQPVKLVLNSNTGWTISTNSGTTLQTRVAAGSSASINVTFTPSTATTVTFSGLGRVVANADASASLTQLDISSPNTTSALRITIASGGMMRLCDPNAATGDPRIC